MSEQDTPGCTSWKALRSLIRRRPRCPQCGIRSRMCGGQDFWECGQVPSSAPPNYNEKEVDLFPPPYTGHGYHPFGPRKATKMNPLNGEVLKVAKEFITFLNRAVTPFHAVQECKALLTAAGFTELPEHGTWRVEQNKRYFITKNRTAIVAFAVGGQFAPGNGFSIVVGHTDSPGLRVKPVSKQSRSNFNQVGVSTYGGGVWRTWFDRDLSIAGEVVYKKKDGELARKLVNVAQPVLFIPNLAIHLETTAEREAFKANTEENVRPILESQAAALLVGDINKSGKEIGPDGKPIVEPDTREPTDCSDDHHVHFLKMIASAAAVDKDDLVDLDLFLYDSNPAAVVGLYSEFISGARLDNLVGTYTAIQGLINSLSDGSLEKDGHIRMAACYDNEEVGSQSMMGAESGFTEHLLRRLSSGGDQCAFETAIARSLLISADQAHACHPNYSQKHEENHRPKFHGGVVVKINHNQRYATTSTTHSVLKQIAQEAKVPLQKVVVRNDSPCGTTVGPILASKLGLAVVDVGCPQLAMHSCREFGDTSSLLQAITLYQQFHRRLPSVFSPLL